VLADDLLRTAEAAARGLDGVAQIGPQLRGRAQLNDGRAHRTVGTQIADIGRLVHWRACFSLFGQRELHAAEFRLRSAPLSVLQKYDWGDEPAMNLSKI